MSDLRRFVLAILGAVLVLGFTVGRCSSVASSAQLDALRDSVARAADDVAYERLVSATYHRAAERNERRADSLVHVADSVTRIAQAVRATVIVRDRVVIDSSGVVHGDSLVADVILASDARHQADSLAIAGLLVTVDTLSRALVQSDSLAAALTRQVKANTDLRVAVEKVSRRPRFGFASGLVVGSVATAGLVHLAGSLR